MAESEQHRRLVQYLHDWVSVTYFDSRPALIATDSRQFYGTPTPPVLRGYKPDLYVVKPAGAGAIIGEAKTTHDLENDHTDSQLAAFLTWCSIQECSLLVLAVPWHVTRLASSVVNNIMRRRRLQAHVIVLDGLDPASK